jgi:ABC-type transport system substrate-binding protein
MKKILALILAMVMCFSMLAACGSKDSGSTAGGTATNSGASTPKTELPSAEVTNKVDGDKGTVDQNVKYRDTVRLSVASEISNGAFYCVTSAQSTYISNMTHQALTRYDYNTSKASPELAESWRDVNGNGKVWEFKLKEGITFQKGDQYYADLKASDVKWTYEWAAPGGPGVQEGVAVRTVTQMNQVDHIETTGDYIITFYLKSPVFDFPEMLGSWNILSEKAM